MFSAVLGFITVMLATAACGNGGGHSPRGMTSVILGGPGLVAVGREDSGDDLDVAVWTSPDWITWSQIIHDEAVFGGEGFQAMNSVTAGGPGLVAVGVDWLGSEPGVEVWTSDAAVWISADGITWSRVTHDEVVFGGEGFQAMNSVTAGGPGLVAVGVDESRHAPDMGVSTSDAVVWTSPDGITWSRVAHGEAVFGGDGFQAMNSVTVGESGLLAVGVDGSGGHQDAAVWASAGGITWSQPVATPPDPEVVLERTRAAMAILDSAHMDMDLTVKLSEEPEDELMTIRCPVRRR